jgi:hypothetical protein
VTYCNDLDTAATLIALTPGHFKPVDMPTISPKSCASYTFVTSENRVLLHVKLANFLKILSYENKSTRIFSSDSFVNLLFLIAGAVLVGIQDFLKYIFIGPVTAAKLWMMYKANVRAFKRHKDDISKRFSLTDTLIEVDTKPSAEAAFFTNSFVSRVNALVDLHRIWQAERPLSLETRKKIDSL